MLLNIFGHIPKDPLGFCLCLCPLVDIWPGPGDSSRKSLVLLHFLCSDTADSGRDTFGGNLVDTLVVGDGAGDMELEVESVWRELEELYMADCLSLLLA